ncbi:odorant receptor Or1-like [Tribolium castaneum]|uniref:odorant receptor Or1-like n=1 Tax=Tribolium castaneum TaxID=7070 RepID=UPI0030FEFA33
MDDTPVKKFFKVNLTVMRLFGFYPPKKCNIVYKIYALIVYVCCTVTIPTLAALHLLVSENVDLAQVCENSFVIFEVGCFMFKLKPFIFNVEKIRQSIYMLNWPIFNNHSKQQEQIINECAWTCRRNTWLFLVFCIITFITWAATPFFTSVYKFPIDVWLPFEATADPKTFFSVYLFIVLGIGNTAISNGVIDPLISGMVYFAVNQLKVLKDNLEYLENNSETQLCFNLTVKHKTIYKKITMCIEHHNAILDFIKYYENVYSPVVFTQFTAAVLVICISCLQLSMV